MTRVVSQRHIKKKCRHIFVTIFFLVLLVCTLFFLFLFLLYLISPFNIFSLSVILTHSSIPPPYFNINILLLYLGDF